MEGKYMSKICGICGKRFGDERRFPMEGGGEMCEECYLAFQDEEMEEIERNDVSYEDKEILEVAGNKEKYSVHKIEETIDTLKMKGYKKQAKELEGYLDNYGKSVETDGAYYNNGKVYQGSKTTIWTNYLELSCYISIIVTTVIGIWLGSLIGGLGSLLGGAIGFIIGFVANATIMMIITMCNNISIMTDNTAKILAKLDEKKK